MKRIMTLLYLAMNVNLYFAQTIPTDSLYLSQKPPADTPNVFAPGIISTPEMQHSAPAFSTDGKEVYWSVTRQSSDTVYQYILFMQFIDKKWTKPALAPFSDGKHYEGSPVISSDGTKLYMYRGGPGSNIRRRTDTIKTIYYTRHRNEWINPVPVECEGISNSVADNGTIYCSGISGITRTVYKNHSYSAPEKLNETINKESFINGTPYIAPDESYLIFSRADRNGDMGELMIAFHDTISNAWSEPQNMGKQINTKFQERFPWVSPDGKYLFFNRSVSDFNDDVFWVSASFIDRIKKRP